MHSAPSSIAENEIVDTEFRAKILPDARAMLDQIKKKSISGKTKSTIEEYFKTADKKDYFSFLLLRFLLLCDSAMTTLQGGGETVQSILTSEKIGIQLTNYDNPNTEPAAEFTTSLEQAIATLRGDLGQDDDDTGETATYHKKIIEKLLLNQSQ